MLTKEILCAYAPFGVKVYHSSLRTIWKLKTLMFRNDGQTYFTLSNGSMTIEDNASSEPYKLILRPLSSLTKPITHNGETFVPMDKLMEISGAFEKDEYFKSEPFRIQIEEGRVIGFSAICLHVNQWELFQKLLSWHFDIFGLLESGHAIELKCN